MVLGSILSFFLKPNVSFCSCSPFDSGSTLDVLLEAEQSTNLVFLFRIDCALLMTSKASPERTVED